MIISLITSLISFLGKVDVLNENVLIQIVLISSREEMSSERWIMFYSRGGSRIGHRAPCGSSPPPVPVGWGKRWKWMDENPLPVKYTMKEWMNE